MNDYRNEFVAALSHYHQEREALQRIFSSLDNINSVSEELSLSTGSLAQ